MTFFSSDEFLEKYTEYTESDFEEWQIEAVCKYGTIKIYDRTQYTIH